MSSSSMCISLPAKVNCTFYSEYSEKHINQSESDFQMIRMFSEDFLSIAIFYCNILKHPSRLFATKLIYIIP